MSPQKLCSAALLGLLIAGPAAAQQTPPTSSPADGRVLGAVVDERTGDPIAGALVLLGDGRVTETDRDGLFVFPRVRPGSHQIAAVTHGCAKVEGGFEVQSGQEATLRLLVQRPASTDERASRSRATRARVIDERKLAEIGDRSLLDAIDYYLPSTFEVVGPQLALRTRQGASSERLIEPLLVMDGVRMDGLVANALSTLKASDAASVEVHLGSAAGWEFQPGGSTAVIEVTTRMASTFDSRRNPASCVD